MTDQDPSPDIMGLADEYASAWCNSRSAQTWSSYGGPSKKQREQTQARRDDARAILSDALSAQTTALAEARAAVARLEKRHERVMRIARHTAMLDRRIVEDRARCAATLNGLIGAFGNALSEYDAALASPDPTGETTEAAE